MARKFDGAKALKKWGRGESLDSIAAFYGFSRFKLRRLLLDALAEASPMKTAKAKVRDAVKTYAALRMASHERRMKKAARARR